MRELRQENLGCQNVAKIIGKLFIWGKTIYLRGKMADEVELKDREEFELVPVGPIRNLERRLERMERSVNLRKEEFIIKDVLDIVKGNQKVVNDMVESNLSLRRTIEDLMSKLDNVVENINSFVKLLKEASESSIEEEISGDLGKRIVDPLADRFESVVGRIDEIANSIKNSNERFLSSLEEIEKRLKRIYAAQRKEEFFRPRIGMQKPEISSPVIKK